MEAINHTSPAAQQSRPCNALRTATILPLIAAFALAMGSQSALAKKPVDLGQRVYVIVPSSEPANITTLSTMKIYDPDFNLLKETDIKGFRPHHLYKVPNKNYGFIAHFGPTAFVEVFDLVKNEVVDIVPTGAGPRHLGFAPGGHYVYTSNFDDNTVSRINTRSFKSQTAPAHGVRPNYVEYVETPNGPYVFTANLGENTLSVLDPRTLALVKKITIGQGPFNFAHSDACECIMTANAVDNTVSWVDLHTLEEVDRKSILTPSTVLNTTQTQRLNPRISPEGRYLWVGNQQGSEFAVFDIMTHQLVTTIPAGFGADIMFFPRQGPGQGYGFGSNRYDTKVTVAKLNGMNPPTLEKQIPVSLVGTHYLTFNEDFTKGYMSERPGGGCSKLDMANQVEESFVATGPGPDQCMYMWSEKNKVFGHTETSTSE